MTLAAVALLAGCGMQPVAHSPAVATTPTPLAVAAPPDLTYPPEAGTPVAAKVLSPASVMPAGPLCAAPLQVFQDGNAGPDFCRDGALNVNAWKWYADSLHPAVMAAGPKLSATAQAAALCAKNGDNMTNPELESAYWLAARYYGWTPIDVEGILLNGCR